jgi:pimeloyl-ACP methyl ester carboxylesterase
VKTLRTYGKPPFSVAVIHGGPGGGGEMAPLARRLSSGRAVLEPIQTAISLEGQVQELRTVLEKHGDLPITLIGFSWGAWLSFIVAARHPDVVGKLVLVGSGPFEAKYVMKLRETRLGRLTEEERAEFESIIRALGDAATKDKDHLLARVKALASETDEYDPISEETQEADSVGIRGDIFQGVWRDASELRSTGKLLELGRCITCPVVAIHGDYDPHPAEGVKEPLFAVLKDFRFILLKNCGHMPWIERQARAEFYRILEQELP